MDVISFLEEQELIKNQFYILHLVSERGFVVPPPGVGEVAASGGGT